MKKILISIFAIILISSLSQALTQENTINYALINQDGSTTYTNQPITNVNTIGYSCADSSCSELSTPLWNGQELSTENSNSITLQYPTILQGSAYGVYLYKDGYIPAEYLTDYAGDGAAPSITHYLAKKEYCYVQPIVNAQIVQAGSSKSLVIDMDVNSPISNSGLLPVIPQTLISQYSVNVIFSAEIKGSTNYVRQSSQMIHFSERGGNRFRIDNIQPGDYNISYTVVTNDQKCINSIPSAGNISITIPQDPVVDHPISLNIINPQDRMYNTNNVPLNIEAINASLVLYSLNGAPNITYSGPTSINAQEGQNRIVVFANNTFGNQAIASRNFRVNTTIPPIIGNPSVNIISPEDKTYRTNTIPLQINSENATSVWYTLNGGPNIVYSGITQITAIEGQNRINAYANNSLGVQVSAIRNFFVNTTIPSGQSAPKYYNISVTPSSPTAYSPSAGVAFRITWTDDENLEEARLYIDNRLYEMTRVGPPASTNEYVITIPPISAGSHTYYFWAIDNDDLINQTSIMSYTVNRANPACSLTLSHSVATNSTPITVQAQCNNPESNFTLTRNGQNVIPENHIPTILPVGNYTYTLTIPQTPNYNPQIISLNLTITSDEGDDGDDDDDNDRDDPYDFEGYPGTYHFRNNTLDDSNVIHLNSNQYTKNDTKIRLSSLPSFESSDDNEKEDPTIILLLIMTFVLISMILVILVAANLKR